MNTLKRIRQQPRDLRHPVSQYRKFSFVDILKRFDAKIAVELPFYQPDQFIWKYRRNFHLTFRNLPGESRREFILLLLDK
jgi:hypothetical protein